MKAFQLAGTASRKQAWIAVLANMVLVGAAIWFGPLSRNAYLAALIFPPLGVAAVWMFATLVRRLHDINRSGGWALLCLLPGIGLIVTVLILCWPPKAQKFAGSPAGRAVGWTLLAGLLTISAFRVFYHPYQITGEDMAPTLLIGDYVVVAPLLGAPDRGAVVLVAGRVGGQVLKRVVGLPGETVQMGNGRLWLNGEEVPMTPSTDFVEIKRQYGPMGQIPRCTNDPVPQDGQCIKRRDVEELPGGPTYDVLNLADGTVLDDTAQITLADDEYFLIGDNRDASVDSRLPVETGGLGPVSDGQINGRARWVLFSTTGWSTLEFWTWRKGRFVEAVQ